ncbi:MAG TPA: MlaD family protein [Acetobacteraceae bacterium]|jgi:paraquat-inducible protein B|nr:MlaD family protein [Acetobacteraceae bacterium]
MSDVAGKPGQVHATTRRSRRFSAIWLLPLVALAIGAWLAWDTLSKEGPTITISFETAEGLQAGQSQLKYRDIVLGTVKTLTLSDDHSHVLITVATTRQAKPLLTNDTQFWVVKPRLFAGNVSGLSTLVSGSYIGMMPGGATETSKRDFAGREDPPVLETNVPGRTFLLKATRLGSVQIGSPVFFRDLSVGEVLGWDLGEMAESATIHAFVRAPYDKYVQDQTRFWDASGLSVKLGGNGIDVQLESLRALLLGGVAFDMFTAPAQSAESVEGHVFPMFANKEAAQAASYSRKVQLIGYFPGSVRGLAAGADVTLHGLKVGQVTDVQITYDAAKQAIVAPVHFEVEPERIVGIGKRVAPDAGAAIDMLVGQGLRATLQSANLLTGQMLVALEFVPDAPPATVTRENQAFVIPTSDSGSFSSLQASAGELLRKVNTIPFESLGRNLNQTLASARDMVQNLDTGLAPTMKKLPDMAAALQKTMTDANRLVLSLQSGYGDNTQFNRDLDRLMIQLNDAVRSIRSLADLLDRHPEALIKGRPAGGVE